MDTNVGRLCPPKSVIGLIEPMPHRLANLAYRGAPGWILLRQGVDGAISISRSRRSGACEAPARVMRLQQTANLKALGPHLRRKEVLGRKTQQTGSNVLATPRPGHSNVQQKVAVLNLHIPHHNTIKSCEILCVAFLSGKKLHLGVIANSWEGF